MLPLGSSIHRFPPGSQQPHQPPTVSRTWTFQTPGSNLKQTKPRLQNTKTKFSSLTPRQRKKASAQLVQKLAALQQPPKTDHRKPPLVFTQTTAATPRELRVEKQAPSAPQCSKSSVLLASVRLSEPEDLKFPLLSVSQNPTHFAETTAFIAAVSGQNTFSFEPSKKPNPNHHSRPLQPSKGNSSSRVHRSRTVRLPGANTSSLLSFLTTDVDPEKLQAVEAAKKQKATQQPLPPPFNPEKAEELARIKAEARATAEATQQQQQQQPPQQQQHQQNRSKMSTPTPTPTKPTKPEDSAQPKKRHQRRATMHLGNRAFAQVAPSLSPLPDGEGLSFHDMKTHQGQTEALHHKELFRLTDSIMRLGRIQIERCLSPDLQAHLDKSLAHLELLKDRAEKREHDVASVVDQNLQDLANHGKQDVVDWIQREYMHRNSLSTSATSSSTHASPSGKKVLRRAASPDVLQSSTSWSVAPNNNNNNSSNKNNKPVVPRVKRPVHGRLSLIMHRKGEDLVSPKNRKTSLPLNVSEFHERNPSTTSADGKVFFASTLETLEETQQSKEEKATEASAFTAVAQEKIEFCQLMGVEYLTGKSRVDSDQKATTRLLDPLAQVTFQLLVSKIALRDEVNLELISCDDWNSFNVFDLHRVTDGHSLVVLTVHLIQELGLHTKFDLDLKLLVNFLHAVQSGYYENNSYHNAIHAADVVQNMYYFMTDPLLQSCLTDLDRLAGIIAAGIHDYAHPGVNNNYMILAESPLAVMYNDQAVLENNSIAQCFRLLKEPSMAAFGNFDHAQATEFRKSVVSMVLNTDIHQHMPMLKAFEEVANNKLAQGLTFTDSRQDRRSLLDLGLHCADLGNPAKIFELYSQWVPRVTAEFYQQGDMEKELGFPIVDMLNRAKPNISIGQVAFIKIICKPLYIQWAQVVKNADVCIENMVLNQARFQEDIDQNKAANEDTPEPEPEPVAAATATSTSTE